MTNDVSRRWQVFQDRYADGEWRTPVFVDLLKSELHRDLGEAIDRADAHGSQATTLDIGCGTGFDREPELQQAIVEACAPAQVIGVEPDASVEAGPWFAAVHRVPFEDAPIESESVDFAWSFMVLEHVCNPSGFFQKLYEVLKPGGVFVGFTVDKRHYYVRAARLMFSLGVADRYLRWLDGGAKRDQGKHRPYYRTYYRCNSPAELRAAASKFAEIQSLGFSKVGQVEEYLPPLLRPAFRAIDRLRIRCRRPGAILVIKIRKPASEAAA